MSLPARIAKYEIVGRLAAGGMAEILLARLTGPSGFERAVVVKRILPHLAAEQNFRTMFLDEARIVARIHHPNVVQVQELGQDGDELYLAMEYLEGESTAALLRRLHLQDRRIDLSLGAYVVAQACAGLHAAHELRGPDGSPLELVHRDVSPQNVFVTYGGEIKVLDFGIAKAADRVTRTETGTFKGKFEYASPEQCLGQPIDRRSDVFAMGVVLYELTTGKRLFKRENHLLTMRAICSSEIPQPSSIVEGYPAELEAICLRALAHDKKERFATAGEMRTELLKAARNLGLEPEADVALARLMADLFADRIETKNDLLKRVRVGTAVGAIPPNESDPQVEVPIAEATLRATATIPSNTTAREDSRRKRAIVGLATAGAVLSFAAAGALLPQRNRAGAPVPDPATPTAEIAPATAAAVATAVTLSIDTNPPGAEVLVDGEPRGVSPSKVTIDRSARAKTIEFRLAGHRSSTQSLVPDVDQKLVVNLVPLPTATPSATASSAARPTPVPKTKPAPAKPKPSSDPFHRFD